MKKNLLLMMLCLPAMLAAQQSNGVKVSGLAVSASTVTFNVSWDKNTMPETLWSDTVWVFVDYNKNGVMERLPITGATGSAGTVTKIPGNDKGVWIAGNAREAGAFSATVKLLTEVKDVGGACVYGSNYPPVGNYTSATKIAFTGTPGYDLVFVGGATTHTESSPYTVPAGYTVQSFIDKTGAPGKLSCIPSATYNLVVSASSFCAGDAGVTFALSGTDAENSYELYKDGATVVATLKGDGSAATFSGFFEAGTYNARTVPGGAYCPAAMTGTHTVNESPLPTITHSGDNAIQSANQNMEMTAITYTASYAATISMTGSLPTGVNGVADGSSYSISGTPAATGTFGYLLTAAVGGCTSPAAVGTITVNAAPPGLYSASTWSIGGYTWSDRVVAKPSGCSQVSTLLSIETVYPPAQYKITSESGVERYYYNWTCAVSVCPSGWSLPTASAFRALVDSTAPNTLMSEWGTGGQVYVAELRNPLSGNYWSATVWSIANDYTYYYLYYNAEDLSYAYNDWRCVGKQVRCVK
jgi:hypothetical protein